ncbi:MAG: hypothetical protein FJ100_07275 [Deltaproteobacteria bacterium]|nr:hypothetical protein [Deltaproteobacteria bacterium]
MHLAAPLRILSVLALAWVPDTALAAVASTPWQFAKAEFADNGQAIEHVTVRARTAGGHETFVRFAIANAGFRKGALEVTFRQESPQGTFYGKETFQKGSYTLDGVKLGLRAGKHTLASAGGQLTATFDFGSTTATVVLSSGLSPFSVSDKNGSGYTWRELMVPMGKVAVTCAQANGKGWEGGATAYAVHEASTTTAHQIYDRSVQLFHFGAPHLVIDYIVLPKDRGGRPLGFLVASGKGKTVAAEVQKETRELEKVDPSTDYRVPYSVSVLAKRGNARAAIKLTGEKQVGRDDDLADLPWAARKAVGAVMHPITYLIKGAAQAEVQPNPTEPAINIDAAVKYKYAQTR